MIAMIETELRKLLEKSQTDVSLRNELLSAEKSPEPMKSFCEICQKNGFEIYLGELLSYGEDMNDSKLRATNGGGSFAIEGWDDALENIFDELKKAER